MEENEAVQAEAVQAEKKPVVITCSGGVQLPSLGVPESAQDAE